MSFSLVGSVVDLVVLVLSSVGLPGLFALMAVESFGIPPIPSEVILPFSGFLVAEGTFSLTGAVSVAVLGGLVGSYAAYAVGRWGRHRLVDLGLGPFRLEARHLERMDAFFARRGEATVGLARLVPTIRSYISYPAGTAKMDPVRFGVYTTLGSVPFTVAFVYAGMVLRSHWDIVQSTFRWFDVAVGVLIVVAIVYVGLVLVGKVSTGWPPRWVPSRPKEFDGGTSGREPAHPRP